jgi:TyrR family helix-turn-helix protein
MNICERLVVMSETELIDLQDLPQKIVRGAEANDDLTWPEEMTLPQIMESVERAVLAKTAKAYRTQSRIAGILGVSQPTIARRMKQYGLGEAEAATRPPIHN